MPVLVGATDGSGRVRRGMRALGALACCTVVEDRSYGSPSLFGKKHLVDVHRGNLDLWFLKSCGRICLDLFAVSAF